jgi:2-iminobutanoate/2-iminopropanoate deaminase
MGDSPDPLTREAIRTADAPAPGGSYSQAIRWGELLFISGQTPRDLDRGDVGGSFSAQADQVYANLRAVAEAAGASIADALRVTVYLRDLGDFGEADAAFARAFPEPRPARTTVGAQLPVSIEIDAVFGLRSPIVT